MPRGNDLSQSFLACARKNYMNVIIRHRINAFLLDLFAIIIINKILVSAYMNFLKTIFMHFTENLQNSIMQWLPLVNLSTFTLVFFGYFFLSYYWGNGESPGKMVFHIKVVSNLKRIPSFRQSAMRSLGYLTCFFSGVIFFLLPLLRADHLGLPDWLSGTHVVMADEEVENDNVLPFNAGKDQLSLFSDKDLAA